MKNQEDKERIRAVIEIYKKGYAHGFIDGTVNNPINYMAERVKQIKRELEAK